MTFDNLLKKCSSTAYPEEHNPAHEAMSDAAVTWFASRLTPPARVLDIGIGLGYAMRQLRKREFDPHGISVCADEVAAVKKDGLSAEVMDMHNISIALGKFDGVFARHCLEHSPCPLLVLNNIHEVLKDDGWLFVEVPAPETPCHHENNQNHFAVHTLNSWGSLLIKAGFSPKEGGLIPLSTQAGPDTYFSILTQKAKS